MNLRTNGSSQWPGHVATGLGWFSIGLGLAELLAPREVARVTGMPFVGMVKRMCRSWM